MTVTIKHQLCGKEKFSKEDKKRIELVTSAISGSYGRLDATVTFWKSEWKLGVGIEFRKDVRPTFELSAFGHDGNRIRQVCICSGISIDKTEVENFSKDIQLAAMISRVVNEFLVPEESSPELWVTKLLETKR